jgi:hypothetical protein
VIAAILDGFLADHRRMETLLQEALTALAANCLPEMFRFWAEFESSFIVHLGAEETSLFPELFAVRPRDAVVLAPEHRHIRAHLAELGTGVGSRIVRGHSLRAFIDELRAHARTGDHVLYRWSDEHFDEQQRTSVIHTLANKSPA